jgi:hypothetical protein
MTTDTVMIWPTVSPVVVRIIVWFAVPLQKMVLSVIADV